MVRESPRANIENRIRAHPIADTLSLRADLKLDAFLRFEMGRNLVLLYCVGAVIFINSTNAAVVIVPHSLSTLQLRAFALTNSTE